MANFLSEKIATGEYEVVEGPPGPGPEQSSPLEQQQGASFDSQHDSDRSGGAVSCGAGGRSGFRGFSAGPSGPLPVVGADTRTASSGQLKRSYYAAPPGDHRPATNYSLFNAPKQANPNDGGGRPANSEYQSAPQPPVRGAAPATATTSDPAAAPTGSTLSTFPPMRSLSQASSRNSRPHNRGGPAPIQTGGPAISNNGNVAPAPGTPTFELFFSAEQRFVEWRDKNNNNPHMKRALKTRPSDGMPSAEANEGPRVFGGGRGMMPSVSTESLSMAEEEEESRRATAEEESRDEESSGLG